MNKPSIREFELAIAVNLIVGANMNNNLMLLSDGGDRVMQLWRATEIINRECAEWVSAARTMMEFLMWPLDRTCWKVKDEKVQVFAALCVEHWNQCEFLARSSHFSYIDDCPWWIQDLKGGN